MPMQILIEELESLNSASENAIILLKNLFVKCGFQKGRVVNNSPWQKMPMLYYIAEGKARGILEYDEGIDTLWIKEKGFLMPGCGSLDSVVLKESIEFMTYTRGFAMNLHRAGIHAQHNDELYEMLLEIYEKATITPLSKHHQDLLFLPRPPKSASCY